MKEKERPNTVGCSPRLQPCNFVNSSKVRGSLEFQYSVLIFFVVALSDVLRICGLLRKELLFSCAIKMIKFGVAVK